MEDPGELAIVTESSFTRADRLISDTSNNWDMIVLDLMEEDFRTGRLLNKGAELAQVARRFLEAHPKRHFGVFALSRSEEDMRAIGAFRREFERQARAELCGYFRTFGVSYLHKDEAMREERGEELGIMMLETLVDAGVLAAASRVSTLRFDLKNPRLFCYDDFGKMTQETAFNLYWNEFDALELANSIYQEGYWQYEPLVGYENNDGTQTIVEGNRRLAAIRGLLDEDFRRSRMGIMELPPEKIESIEILPAVIYSSRDEIPEAYIAFKHHNAPFRWRGLARAASINGLVDGNRDLGAAPLALAEVAIRCGDSEDVTAMYYRAFRILEQARTTPLKGKKGEVIYDPKWRYNYPFAMNFESLALGLWRVGIQDYLGVLDQPKSEKFPIKGEGKQIARLRQLLVWALGDNRNGTPPRLLEGTHDWGLLEALVYDDDAIDMLDTGQPLSEVAKRIEPRDGGDTQFMTPEARIHLDLVAAENRLKNVFEHVKIGNLNAVQWDMVGSIGELANLIGEYRPGPKGEAKRSPWKTPV
jgi:hypothetical protein